MLDYETSELPMLPQPLIELILMSPSAPPSSHCLLATWPVIAHQQMPTNSKGRIFNIIRGRFMDTTQWTFCFPSLFRVDEELRSREGRLCTNSLLYGSWPEATFSNFLLHFPSCIKHHLRYSLLYVSPLSAVTWTEWYLKNPSPYFHIEYSNLLIKSILWLYI